MRKFRSLTYNYNFDENTGYFERWGKTVADDPEFSIFGNEILDIEITDICNGVNGKVCPFCYKSNKPTNTNNMSLENFKTVIDKMPKIITQIAIGADAQATANPHIWKMMEYSRSKGIVPNITVADISNDTADKLAKYCGAVSVSLYDDKNYCYDSVKKLVDRGMKQINIHVMVHKNNLAQIYDVFDDYRDDERLKGMNSIVLLSLKKKGRGETFDTLPQDKFNFLVNYALDNDVPFGFDSCSCHKFLESVKDHEDFKTFSILSEPCESGLFSAYVNVNAEFFPCSFTENTNGWETGIKIDNDTDFLKDIWYNSRTIRFRVKLLANGRNCPIYQI